MLGIEVGESVVGRYVGARVEGILDILGRRDCVGDKEGCGEGSPDGAELNVGIDEGSEL